MVRGPNAGGKLLVQGRSQWPPIAWADAAQTAYIHCATGQRSVDLTSLIRSKLSEDRNG